MTKSLQEEITPELQPQRAQILAWIQFLNREDGQVMPVSGCVTLQITYGGHNFGFVVHDADGVVLEGLDDDELGNMENFDVGRLPAKLQQQHRNDFEGGDEDIEFDDDDEYGWILQSRLNTAYMMHLIEKYDVKWYFDDSEGRFLVPVTDETKEGMWKFINDGSTRMAKNEEYYCIEDDELD